ncbi:uncharacterized protein [Dermacentor andersoni]|uniref:uncharacterized protein n=1 Tax=Dermacentor andersoni TaxID=34620 RepID=UPI0024176A60|nr:uncharacterized protein LOC126548516 [Dermacentor andersoni]
MLSRSKLNCFLLLLLATLEVQCSAQETTTRPTTSFKLHRPLGFNRNGTRTFNHTIVTVRRKPLFSSRRLKPKLENAAPTSTESLQNVVPDYKKSPLEGNGDAAPTTTIFPPPPVLRPSPIEGAANAPQVVPTEPTFNPDTFFTTRKKNPVVVVRRFPKGPQGQGERDAAPPNVGGPPHEAGGNVQPGLLPIANFPRPLPRPGYGYQPAQPVFGGSIPLDVLSARGIPKFFTQRDIDFVAQAFRNAAGNESIPPLNIPTFNIPSANQTQQPEQTQGGLVGAENQNQNQPRLRVPENVLRQGYADSLNGGYPNQPRPPLDGSQQAVPPNAQQRAPLGPGGRPLVFQMPNGAYRVAYQPQAGPYPNNVQPQLYPNVVPNGGYPQGHGEDQVYGVDPRLFRPSYPIVQGGLQVPQRKQQPFNPALQHVPTSRPGQQTLAAPIEQGRANPGLVYQNYLPVQNLSPVSGFSPTGTANLQAGGYAPSGAVPRGFRFIPIPSNDRVVALPDEVFANSFTPNQLVEIRDGRAIPVQPVYAVYPGRNMIGYPPPASPKEAAERPPAGGVVRRPLYQGEYAGGLDVPPQAPQKRTGFIGGREPEVPYSAAAHDVMYTYRPDVLPGCTNGSKEAIYCLQDDEYPRAALHLSVDLEQNTMHRLLPETPEGDGGAAAALFVDSVVPATESTRGSSHGEQASGSGVNSTVVESPPPLTDDGSLFACAARVTHARPLRARTVQGLWKVVVNMHSPHGRGAFQQMVRTEECMEPGGSCSNLVQSSRCVQKYNLHRLVVWTRQEGIHMDTFRLPVACSCYLGKADRKATQRRAPSRT